MTYTGTWQRGGRAAAHNGQVYWTERSGSAVTLRFTGTAVAWVGPRYQAGSIAGMSIDGAFQTTVAQTGFSEREVLLSWVWPTPGGAHDHRRARSRVGRRGRGSPWTRSSSCS